MRNPFSINVVDDEDDFCNRKTEIRDLVRYAQNSTNVVLFSPRRFGKTSLVKRVLKLQQKKMFTTYVDLLPITSENDILQRFALGVFKGIGKGVDPRTVADKVRSLFSRFIVGFESTQDGMEFTVKFDKTAKIDFLLDDLMEGIRKYVKKEKRQAVIVLDEFQQVVSIPESKRIEGILRAHIQTHKDIAYFFVGSKRRTLKDMFSDESRPFYKSAFLYILNLIDKKEFIPFIEEKFKNTGKICPAEVAGKIYELVAGYPYYVQKLAFNSWEITEKKCDFDIIRDAYRQLIKMEAFEFEGIWGGLSLLQKSVLKAIAEDPTKTPYAKEFLNSHGLSATNVQKGIDSLIEKDCVEKDDRGVYRLVDPVMRAWITIF